jgi:hypothetical protein
MLQDEEVTFESKRSLRLRFALYEVSFPVPPKAEKRPYSHVEPVEPTLTSSVVVQLELIGISG